MQRHEMDRKVVGVRCDIQRFAVLDLFRIWDNLGRGANDKGRFKLSVNQTQAIKEFIPCDITQEPVIGAVAIADQSGAISKEGHILHMLRHIAQTRGVQTLIHSVFPPECLSCRASVASDDGLCGLCWRDTAFIAGDVCDGCGVPLRGDVQSGDRCDDCLRTARPWVQGRSALLYKDRGRALVLALKHGDRHDIVKPAGKWMARCVQDTLRSDVLVAPVPLHWTRMVKRRYNQSSLIARAMAGRLSVPICADLLRRDRATATLDGKTREARFDEMRDAISVHPKREKELEGRSVLLVDDVMTSGATLAACTEACLKSRAREVCVVTLARVAKDD